MPDFDDLRPIAALIAALVAVGLWFLARAYEFFVEGRQRGQVRTNFIRALYAEIDFNTADMDLFLSKPFTPAMARTMREKEDLIPHIVDARHTEFYRNNISELHHVSDDLIGKVINFYGMLERLTAQIEALHRPSFLSITPDSRVEAVMRIYKTAEDCFHGGTNLLSDLGSEEDRLRLSRTQRAEFFAPKPVGKKPLPFDG